MKRVIITFLCLLCIVQAYSQSFTISGTIIDGERNEPLIGAGILVKGAGRGTITNKDGKYSLEVKRGETLVFSFVGYQNQEVAITNQRTLKLSEAMREKMLLSFELFPPKTEKGMANLPGTIEHLMKYRPEYISSTYGAGGGNVGANREVCQNYLLPYILLQDT